MQKITKESIFKYIDENPSCSFANLLQEFEDSKGTHFLTAHGKPNVYLWNGLSKAIADIIVELQTEKRIFGIPSTVLVYACDGITLNMPVVKRNHDYKSPHWLPVVFFSYDPTKKLNVKS